MGRWVKIRRYHVRESVLVERALLESAGLMVWSPDEVFYGIHPEIGDTSREGYRLFVIEDDVADARALLSLRDDSQVSYPCPESGGKTRRLKRIWATVLLTLLALQFGGPAPWPVQRRMRICVENRHRYEPEPPEPFTAAELGLPAADVGAVSLKDGFLRFLAWSRSVGYEKQDESEKEPPKP